MLQSSLLKLLFLLSVCLVAPPLCNVQSMPAMLGMSHAHAATTQKNTKQKSPAKGKEAPHASARHLGATIGAGSSWYLDGAPRAGRGAVWERGIPMENLSRKRTHSIGGAPSASGQTPAGTAGVTSPSAAQVRELGRERGAVTSSAAAAQGKGRGPGSSVVAAGSGATAATGGAVGIDTTKGIDSALGELSSYERQPADGSATGLNKPGAPSLQMTTEESSWRNPVTQPHTGGQDVMTSRHNVVGAYADVVRSDDLRVTMGPELHIPESDPTVKHLSPQQNESSTLGFGMKWQWDF